MSTDESPDPKPVPTFAELGLDEDIASAVSALGFDHPTPIQAEAIPSLLEGKDIIGRARTGSGKTAAFGLPLLHKVREGGKKPRGLVLCNTRELALQVTDALRSYGKKLPLRILAIYGGAPYDPQFAGLKRGVAVVVGTPGRVIDHIEKGSLDLSEVEMLVLDEADEMLKMGFMEEVEKILAAAPDSRQTALFSATMPDEIRRVAQTQLRNPIEVQVESQGLTTAHIEQRFLVVPYRNKADALSRVLASEPRGTTLVFARTRRGCAEAADTLAKSGISCDALHGDLNQAARERVLLRLRSKALDVVIATDVAARGIDVDHITHVINLDMPPDPEQYTHRIGRTARAGREGCAISFITPKEKQRLAWFEKILKVKMKEMPAPSDADIDRSQRARLLARLKESEPEAGARAWLDELIADQSAEDIAASALSLLAEVEGLSFSEAPSEERPFWSRSKGKRAGPREEFDEIEVMVPVGKRHGVRAGDLVGALANEGDIPGSKIGRITIVPGRSFVGVDASLVDKLIKEHPSIEIRGVEVPLKVARPMPKRPRKPDGFKKRPDGFKKPGYKGKKDFKSKPDGAQKPEGFKKKPEGFKGKPDGFKKKPEGFKKKPEGFKKKPGFKGKADFDRKPPGKAGFDKKPGGQSPPKKKGGERPVFKKKKS